jgi:hypothetical protein
MLIMLGHRPDPSDPSPESFDPQDGMLSHVQGAE